jgi:hypothetical protein
MPIPYRYPRELLPVPPIGLKDPTVPPNIIQLIYDLKLYCSDFHAYMND